MTKIDAAQVQALLHEALTSAEPPRAAQGQTIGAPWSADRWSAELAKLKAALVPPRLERYLLKDTTSQMRAAQPPQPDFWTVAAVDGFLIFYDPEAGDFGLACASQTGGLPETLGVRGDLFGTFCAR